ncbi:MAG: hypothetical protein IKV20_03895 [Clostridia bacterium]|nr:hypothetical protein [Clostridia bacterium]
MNKVVSRKITLTLLELSLLIAVVALAMLSNSGLGWFASNDRVDATEMSVSVRVSSGLTGELKSYPVTDITDDLYTIFYGEESYSLPINDPNSITYSEYKKALAIIITLNASSATEVRVSLSASSADENIDSVINKISNCIKVSTATLSEDLGVATKSQQSLSFLSVTDGEAKKSRLIDFGRFALAEGENRIVFLIEYDEELLDFISRRILKQDPGAFRITYANDINFTITE